MAGLPKDPVTKKEIPLSINQTKFIDKVWVNSRNKKQIIYQIKSALRKRNDIEIRKDIQKITESILPDINNESLPILPKDRIEWEYHCRSKIKGEPNRLAYLPMMMKIIKDTHPFQMYLLARQWGKTTMIGTDLGYYATTNTDYDQTYVNFKLDNLRTFSENKFRQDLFGTEPLSHYISGVSKLGAMNRVVTKKRSVIDMILTGHMWENLLGKSNRRLVVDEGQDIDWDGFQNARETQADTFGDLVIAGVGGFVDTQYHNIWQSTNQMEYSFKYNDMYEGYDNMSWRNKLQFDENGLVYGDYMKEILDGDWIPEKEKNSSRHGYHLSQLQNPRIPLTIKDAEEKYKISSEFSIEWKLKDPNNTQIDLRRNVYAEFVEGELKPITTKDMLKLCDKSLFLTKAQDVDHEKGDVFVGTDIGGIGKTVVWIWQCINSTAPIFQLLWVQKIETGDTDEQIEQVLSLIDAYEADFIATDAGGGSSRTQAIQKRYGTRSRRITYHVRPEKPTPTDDEYRKQESELRYVIDRTFSIDRIIDLIKHPYVDGNFTSNRIIIPNAEPEKVKWIIKQFVALEGETANLKTTGQQYIKYIHKDSEPDDALQACNYSYIAWDLYDGGYEPPVFTQFKSPDPYGY